MTDIKQPIQILENFIKKEEAPCEEAGTDKNSHEKLKKHFAVEPFVE
jgi:hypothetical protein